jgi:hypothetical protein
MLSSNLTLLFAFAFLLIGIIGKLIKKETFDIFGSIFNRLFILGIFLSLVYSFSHNERYSYITEIANHDRKKYHIPSIDSTMQLISRQKNEEFWVNLPRLNSDSIGHSKKIEIDNDGIFKETDFFINYKTNKTIVLETVLPGFLRKYKSNIQIISTIDYYQNITNVTKSQLLIPQADSILMTWRLDTNSIYKKRLH